MKLDDRKAQFRYLETKLELKSKINNTKIRKIKFFKIQNLS